VDFLKRFLATPIGWIALLVVEYAILLSLVKAFMPADVSATAWWAIVGGAVVGLTIFNFLLRKRWQL
jgi:membrane associated rhomboid family serine protease